MIKKPPKILIANRSMPLYSSTKEDCMLHLLQRFFQFIIHFQMKEEAILLSLCSNSMRTWQTSKQHLVHLPGRWQLPSSKDAAIIQKNETQYGGFRCTSKYYWIRRKQPRRNSRVWDDIYMTSVHRAYQWAKSQRMEYVCKHLTVSVKMQQLATCIAMLCIQYWNRPRNFE